MPWASEISFSGLWRIDENYSLISTRKLFQTADFRLQDWLTIELKAWISW